MLGLNDLFDWDYQSKSKIICRSASGIVMTFKKSFILLTIFKDPEVHKYLRNVYRKEKLLYKK